jgi:uncharacterized protein
MEKVFLRKINPKEFTMKKLLMTLLSSTLLFAGTQIYAKPPAPKLDSSSKIIAHPAIWIVKDSDTTIYLFGTMHATKSNIVWFVGDVQKAYEASQEVVFELLEPDPKEMQPLVMKLGIDSKGPALTKKLDAETLALYEKATKDLGIPTAAFEPFQPWFAGLNISLLAFQKAGLDPESGIEKQLFAAVKRDKKTAIGLETAEQQLGYFASLPQPLQISFLKETLKQLPKIQETVDKIVTSWANGNSDDLAETLNESMDSMPELKTKILTERNQRWAAWIKTRMAQPGTVFIAVGGGHLSGKDSVQDFLKSLNIEAKRIKS